MRVAGLGYSEGARNLEVMLESLSGGRRREIQEDGMVMEVKKNLFTSTTPTTTTLVFSDNI